MKLLLAVVLLALLRRSREGARIEINRIDVNVIPQTCRSREGARIEIAKSNNPDDYIMVAPVRERGLKWYDIYKHNKAEKSLP